MAGTVRPDLPANWETQGEEVFCLNCRRELAAEEGIVGLREDAPAEERRKLRSRARIEFEIQRDPDRPDNRIAKACSTSIPAVRKARAGLGVAPAELKPMGSIPRG
ncbi:MAG: hypothetical protein M3M99_08000 [Actinomycetota bacterium]|nr:hypothetical protein [Actinomycetota bacterium]